MTIFKWASTRQQKKALYSSQKVSLNGRTIRISCFEMQIAYKLYLGSDKDTEDARYLFELFRDRLDLKKLETEIGNLDISIRDAKEKLE